MRIGGEGDWWGVIGTGGVKGSAGKKWRGERERKGCYEGNGYGEPNRMESRH